jgi:hypothetical protein
MLNNVGNVADFLVLSVRGYVRGYVSNYKNKAGTHDLT